MLRGQYKREPRHYRHLLPYSFKKGYKFPEERKKTQRQTMKDMWRDGVLKPHHPWNYNHLQEEDERVRKYTQTRINSPSYEETKRKIGRANALALIGHTPHNKGKKKDNYLPTLKASLKLKEMGNRGLLPVQTEIIKTKLRIATAKQKNIRVSQAELFLRKKLDEIGIKYIPSHSILLKNDLFLTIVDIYFPQAKLCVYADGDYWHANPQTYKPDYMLKNGKTAQQTWDEDIEINKTLIENGYTVLRIWDSEIKKNPKLCINKIIALSVVDTSDSH